MLRKNILILLAALGWVALLIPATAIGQASAAKDSALQKSAAKVELTSETGGTRFDPGSRPDPFLNPLIQKRQGEAEADEEIPRGTPPPGISGMNVGEVELLGIAAGLEGKKAVFKGIDKRVYFLHEGDRLFDGHIKAINIDKVLLVRETKLRSGKVLTQEITKRLRTK
jgi:hypothetical protein